MLQLYYCLTICLSFLGIAKAELRLCSDSSFQGFGICATGNGKDYDESEPPQPWPYDLEKIVTMYDVATFRQDDRSITLFVKLLVKWNDTRITMKSSDPDKY